MFAGCVRALLGVLWWRSPSVDAVDAVDVDDAVDAVDAVEAVVVVYEDVGGVLYMRHPCLCVFERTCPPLTTVRSRCHGNQQHLTNDTTPVDNTLNSTHVRILQTSDFRPLVAEAAPLQTCIYVALTIRLTS